MKFETFTGATLGEVFKQVREALGEDAVVADSRTVTTNAGRAVRVVAVREREVERFRERLTSEALPAGRGPLVLALVGPTGAGKTTTLAKLALSPHAFGGRRVGIVTLDTFRVGALEQIQTYAEVAGLPLEVVYDAREVPAAMERLAGCEVVLVDTPGRGPRARADDGEWRESLDAVAPAETHLVLPATLRPDIAEAIRDAYAPLGMTHLLLSKLDEVPDEAGVAELAYHADLPARWVADGQDVPGDLRPGVARILSSVGRPVPTHRPATAA
jgi:flagellar biosynthesis protein FlhF